MRRRHTAIHAAIHAAIFAALAAVGALSACHDDPESRRPDTESEAGREEDKSPGGDDSSGESGVDYDTTNPWEPPGGGDGSGSEDADTPDESGDTAEHPYPSTLYIVDYAAAAWAATATPMELVDAEAGMYVGIYEVSANSSLRLMEAPDFLCYWNVGGGERPGTLRRSPDAPGIAVEGTGPRLIAARLSDLTVKAGAPASLTLCGSAIAGGKAEARAMDDEGLSWKAVATFTGSGTWTLTVNGDAYFTLGGAWSEDGPAAGGIEQASLLFGGAALTSPGEGKRRVYVSLGGYPAALQAEPY